MSNNLFRMPNSLEHFHDKESSYIALYAKGLCESCYEVGDADYESIFGRWNEHFLPKDTSKAKIYFLDWRNIRRKLTALIDESIFEEERKNGKIGRHSPYVGNKTLEITEQRLENQEYFLAKHFGINIKDVSSLEITTRKSKSYFAEKYNFCVGIEEYAKDLGYHCLFVTMTVPAYMHANPNNGNSSWIGSTAKEARKYLVSKWGKFTNDLSRPKNNIKLTEGDLFGIRVIEPHQSGTPHMHALIYSSPELIDEKIPMLLKKQFGESTQAIRISHFRMECKESKPPVGYIVKHLSGAAEYSNDISVKEKAKRIDAWKRVVKGRSFQPFGKTAPIGQWRLFRKFFTQFYKDELTMIPETDSRKIEEFKSNGITALGYKVMHQTRKAESQTSLKRQFAEFIHALKNLESTGHEVKIKESHIDKYGKQKYKTIGIDNGFIKFMFKSSVVTSDS